MAFTIAVVSGKGGTGKTLVAVGLALALASREPCALLDCDVEAPNARLFLQESDGDLVETAVTTRVPVVDSGMCDACSARRTPVCREACAFGAIAVPGGRVMLFPELCHGCGACVDLCPRGAVFEGERPVGSVSEGRAGPIHFVEGRLRVGEARSIEVIRAAKKRAPEGGIAVLDGPPGASCPVVETLRGADAALLVTEPTPFGRHDLEAALDVCRELPIPAGAILNRCDLGDAGVEDLLCERGVPVLLRIPHDREIAVATAKGLPLTAVRPNLVAEFARIADDLRAIAGGARS